MRYTNPRLLILYLYFTSHRCRRNRELRFCLPHLHSTPPLRGPRRNIAISCGIEKLEWCSGYSTVKNADDMITRSDTIQKRTADTETPRDGIGRAYA